MKLMPEQPTEEMLLAGSDAQYDKDGGRIWANPIDIYKAMFAAAPNIEHEEIAKLKREKEMLVEALQFYTEDVVYDDDIIGLKVIKTGCKAREALGKVKG